jgi:hypothetical protein
MTVFCWITVEEETEMKLYFKHRPKDKNVAEERIADIPYQRSQFEASVRLKFLIF